MLNPQDAAALAATAAATTKIYQETEKIRDRKSEADKVQRRKTKLPIINPLVRLPQWPSEYSD